MSYFECGEPRRGQMSAHGTPRSADEQPGCQAGIVQRESASGAAGFLLDSSAPVHQHRRAFGNKGGVRRATENFSEAGSIKRAAVAFEPSILAHPHAPGIVRHAIFDALACALRRISPVVLGNETLERPIGHWRRRAACLRTQLKLSSAPAPPISRRKPVRMARDAMPHRAESYFSPYISRAKRAMAIRGTSSRTN